MTSNRKVCKDFDKTKQYNVNVSKCSKDMKERVQQAFFDVGFLWEHSGAEYRHHEAEQYSNATCYGEVTPYCMYGSSTLYCNMSAQEFLNLVYGDDMDNKGHVHAELMAQYAEDAKTSKTPWELWEYLDKDDGWSTFKGAPGWYETSEYRRKPKTHFVHGVEIPDLRVTPELSEYYYLADSTESEFTYRIYSVVMPRITDGLSVV